MSNKNGLKEIVKDVQSTFDDVALRYDTIKFFKISAAHIVSIINPIQAHKILDVATGTGNVVIECAKALPNVQFDAIDISKGMIEVAKQKSESLSNISFFIQDIEKLNMNKKYNIITCSYALFFLPNPIDTLKILYTHLEKNGKLIFTSFVSEAFEPSKSILLKLIKSYGIETYEKSNDADKWQELQTYHDIKYLCQKAEITSFEMSTKEIGYPMNLNAWWDLNNDAGFRGMLMQLSHEDYEALKIKYYEEMKKHLDSNNEIKLVTDTHFCVITKV
jgi:ubiquinone/menaquinone biosynthesis C-methylase UbiE